MYSKEHNTSVDGQGTLLKSHNKMKLYFNKDTIIIDINIKFVSKTPYTKLVFAFGIKLI